ncbi:hypothetical protein SmB9_18200 [Sphingosinicella microcystinivorans]|uniref:Phosphatidylglycerol lysyltransferase n=3 Tax=Sphingosinicella microcystinivorans TaxID=335406 RepID=A0AAD1D5G8_SPHMI|nr:phosphatidylglycerol lysyltransferase [Sphingosinicella microcystinivorans]BBE34162.1 hypothetical protein SmB9_18200 [Sphingosinicella microcystinivorans]
MTMEKSPYGQTLWHMARRPAVRATAVIVLAAFVFAALHHLIADVKVHDVTQAFDAVTGRQIAVAAVLTAASYTMLTFYDVLALRLIGLPLPYRTAALASFTSYTLSHNFGFALLTGGSARYRIYSSSGIGAPDIVRIIAAAGVTFWAGIFIVAAIALSVHPSGLHVEGWLISESALRGTGITILAVCALLVASFGRKPGTLRIWKWSFPRPSTAQACAMIAVASLDLAAASAALLALVPGAGLGDFPSFFLAYALAIIATLLSHVPGGLGVFETVILAAMPGIDQPALLAALVMYRIIYYLVPLALASVLLAFHARRSISGPIAVTMEAAGGVLRGIAPTFLGALVFVGGMVLLVSGSLPALHDRLSGLRAFLPLPFVEASHIAASLVGTALLLLAPGLYRRLDAAFLLCRALVIAGAVFSLAKGLDYEEALVLMGIAALLQLSRPAFYRKTALTATIGSPQTLTAVGVALALVVWIGFFAYKHVDYQNQLWWQFAWHADASRFLRASFAIAIALVIFLVLRFFGHANPADEIVTDAPPTLEASNRAEAMLVLTGDKQVLRSQDGGAWLMYRIHGQSWIVMGDPIGPEREWPDLLWTLRERADRAQGRLLLYQISLRTVPVAIDLGLRLIKYGEEARVPLASFALDGPGMKSLRYAERRAARDGAVFEIIPVADFAAHLTELHAVSDAWLKQKGNTEKGFSVGRFDPTYLGHFDTAVVRREGKIVAFANIWATDDREELSVDLMRHVEDLPYGAMDFLFAHLMEWGRTQGFRGFNLGLAPLSGIEARRLAPFWARAGRLLYRHGGALYGFEGLRAYKEKFQPVWEARYIAGPDGIGFARSLVDLLTLINTDSAKL